VSTLASIPGLVLLQRFSPFGLREPEIADVGLAEAEAFAIGRKIRVTKVPLASSAKAHIEGDTRGFVKILSDPATGVDAWPANANVHAAGGDWAVVVSGTAATVYDLVYGDLQSLSTSRGNFTTAVRGCLADNLAQTYWLQSTAPSAGQGSWYAVRKVTGGVPGSYDEGGAQTGSRDAEIAASGIGCP